MHIGDRETILHTLGHAITKAWSPVVLRVMDIATVSGDWSADLRALAGCIMAHYKFSHTVGGPDH